LNVVVCGTSFQFTKLDEVKLLPMTVRVNDDPPAVADDGDNVVMTGIGC
jgi:hypothetical protein